MIDEWFEEVVKKNVSEKVALFRYCDDLVIVCCNEHDTKRIITGLKNRLNKFGLKLNEDKTKLISFRRTTDNKANFDFLGFTFYFGKSRKGFSTVMVKTSGKRMRTKLKTANQWFKMVRNRYKLSVIWEKLKVKLRGHINYYGVSFNCQAVSHFIRNIMRMAFKWLNRRSQKKSFNWEQFQLFTKAHPLPKARIVVKLF